MPKQTNHWRSELLLGVDLVLDLLLVPLPHALDGERVSRLHLQHLDDGSDGRSRRDWRPNGKRKDCVAGGRRGAAGGGGQ